jgi:hypothetical protein
MAGNGASRRYTYTVAASDAETAISLRASAGVSFRGTSSSRRNMVGPLPAKFQRQGKRDQYPGYPINWK